MKNGKLKIGDFGIAKALTNSKNNASTVIGTPYYFSPEIINGEGHNKLSDWWSFGVLLYELLHGVTPFHDEKIERIFDLITTSKIRFNSKIVLTPETKDFILKLLNKNPNERIGKGEYDEIISYPFFKSVDPKRIVALKASPFEKPKIDANNPLKNFDDMYLDMEIEDFDEAADMSLLNKISHLFESFEK